MKLKSFILLIICICGSVAVHCQEKKASSSFKVNESFEFVLRDIISYINKGVLNDIDEDIKIIIDAAFNEETLNPELFQVDTITIPIQITTDKITIKNKFSDPLFTSDVELTVSKIKVRNVIPAPPLQDIYLNNYNTRWEIQLTNLGKKTSVNLYFKGASKAMQDEITNYLNDQTKGQLKMNQFLSTNKLENQIKGVITKSKTKTYLGKEKSPTKF